MTAFRALAVRQVLVYSEMHVLIVLFIILTRILRTQAVKANITKNINLTYWNLITSG